MSLQVVNLTQHAASLQKGEWMIIKIGCIVQNTAYFLFGKIYLFLLVFFLAFA